MATTRISLSEEVRERIGEILNASLASAIDLKTQLKHAHWNVTGLEFLQVHESLRAGGAVRAAEAVLQLLRDKGRDGEGLRH